MSAITDRRLFAAAIAFASGIYSVVSAFDVPSSMMAMNDWVMLVVGLAVIVHGTVLLTPLSDRIGRVSGPLMVGWAAIMLANQAVATQSGSMMTSWDGGMVTLALLMLVSGVIMSLRPSSM